MPMTKNQQVLKGSAVLVILIGIVPSTTRRRRLDVANLCNELVPGINQLMRAAGKCTKVSRSGEQCLDD